MKIWAVGDAVGLVGEKIGDMIFDDNPDHFFYLGDVYESGTVEEYRWYDKAFGKLKNRTRPIPGNHEYGSGLSGYKEYWSDFPKFHKFFEDGWLFLFVDTNQPINNGTEQYEWIKKHQANHTGPIIFCHHHHIFSAGGHGDETMVRDVLEIFKDRCCIGLSGHTHNMQRFHTFNGYTQFVVGSGGRSLYGINQADPRLAWSRETYGALRLQISHNRIIHEFFSPSGDLLDHDIIWTDGPKVTLL